jgi:hypothetical protein
MFNKLKQFKDLRNQAKQLQGELAQETAEGTAEWNKIKVLANGNMEILSVQIDPELISVDKKEKLENGIKEAANSAIKKAQSLMAEKVKSSGFKMPEL